MAPLRVSLSIIDAFVYSRQDWVLAATNKVERQRQKINKLGPENYIDGVFIPYHGNQVRIRLKPTTSEKSHIEFNDDEFTIYVVLRLVENNSEIIKDIIIEWMKNQALKAVEDYVDLHARKLNLYPRKIRIKTQKSRWGSCGIHDDINLNWLLILAPPKVMEYVVVHELCHIKERNHSAEFWQLVEDHFPDYKIHRYWLKQNGMSLMQGL